jgi:hypothetical protein
MDRTKFKWDVVLVIEETGETVERVLEAYWSPDYVDKLDEGSLFIAQSAAADAFMESKRRGKQKTFRPVSAQLQAAA